MSDVLARLPNKVAEAEREYVRAWRLSMRLALSGGGIRSAVFCLGVLQAFAKHDILKRFDYLSTVSGGGYIGASLTWFTQAKMPFSVERDNLPYGIDDPTQSPPKDPRGEPLLPHLRRHGSYLDPGGPLSLLAGVAVVMRGLVLNLFVIWLPLVTLAFVLLRMGYRSLAYSATYDGKVWLQPWVFVAIASAIFAILAIFYSVQLGWRAKSHKDMPYKSRQKFERISPHVLGAFAFLVVLGSLPYARDLVFALERLPKVSPVSS